MKADFPTKRTIGRNLADRTKYLFIKSNWVEKKCLGVWWGRERHGKEHKAAFWAALA